MKSKNIKNKKEKEKIDEKSRFYKEINNKIFKYWTEVAKIWDKVSKKVNQLKN